MILIDVEKLDLETIILIGKDLGILDRDAGVTDENINKVIWETSFNFELSLPVSMLKESSIKDNRFKLMCF